MLCKVVHNQDSVSSVSQYYIVFIDVGQLTCLHASQVNQVQVYGILYERSRTL